MLAFAFGVALLTGIVFGLAPAIGASRHDVASQLRSDTAGAGTRRSRTRNALVVGQLALSLVLLVSAGLFVRALDRGQRVNPGFDASRVTVAGFDTHTFGYDSTRGRRFYDDLKARLSATSGVTTVSYASILPLSGNNSGDLFRVDGYTPGPGESEQGIPMFFSTVDADYFATLRMPMVRGRTFAPADGPTTPRVAVVSEAFAGHFWPSGDAIGHTFRRDSVRITIVGVVRDAKFGSLNEAPRLFVYFNIAQGEHASRSLLVRTNGALPDASGAVRDVVRDLDAALPVPQTTSLEAVTEHFARRCRSPRPRRRSAAGFTPGLVLKAPYELGAKAEPGVLADNVACEGPRPPLRVAARDVQPGGELQQMTLGIQRRVDLVPHVADDDLGRASPPFDRPSRTGAEDPGDVAAGLLEGNRVAVELRDEPDVVQHRGHVEQLRIEPDAVARAIRDRPHIRPDAVIHQRG